MKISPLTLVPVIVVLGLAGVSIPLLGRDASVVPSALISKPVPQYEFIAVKGLMQDGQSVKGFGPKDFAPDKITIVNVFASWCAPCRDEHPYITQLAMRNDVQVFGINYGDNAPDMMRFLAELGNPYDRIGFDERRRGGIEWGVYGVPETYLVGLDGRVKKRFVGPIDQVRLDTEVLPALKQIQREAASSSSGLGA